MNTLPLIPAVLGLLIPSGAPSMLPATIPLFNDPEGYSGYVREAQIIVDREQEFPEFDVSQYGFTYVATSATGHLDGQNFILDRVTFQKFQLSNGFSAYRNPTIYSFSAIMPVSNILYVYEAGNAFGSSSDLYKFGVPDVNYYNDYGFPYRRLGYTSTTSGPYVVKYSDSAEWLDQLTPSIYPSFVARSQGVEASFNEGYEAGREYGYRWGYSDGVNAQSEGHYLDNIVQGIVSVPVYILNGLSIFTIFDTPIVGILISLMFAGLLLYLIKRFI